MKNGDDMKIDRIEQALYNLLRVIEKETEEPVINVIHGISIDRYLFDYMTHRSRTFEIEPPTLTGKHRVSFCGVSIFRGPQAHYEYLRKIGGEAKI